MIEYYYSENNKIIKDFLELDSDLDDEDFIEQVQEKINNKYDELLKTNEEIFELDTDILNNLPIKIDNIINFFNVGEHIFSMELLIKWIELFIDEINISNNIKIGLNNIEIQYLNNKFIFYKPNIKKDKNILLNNDLKDIIDKKNKLEEEIYLYYPGTLKSEPIIKESYEKVDKNQYKSISFLQYKVNRLKKKLINKKIKKDIKFTINGKNYNFKSNYINEENNIKTKKEKRYFNFNKFWKDYNNKYGARITDDYINKKKLELKENDENKKLFWEKYNKSKKESKEKLDENFKDVPIIKINKESFNNKYKDKKTSSIYKNIIEELNMLEKEYNNFKMIEVYYKKLNENIENKPILKYNKSKIVELFSEYENSRVTEFNYLKNIGELIFTNKLSKEEKKEINSLNQNTRSARILKQSQRVYLLEEFINIKNIALSGISNWLRDTSDDNFNILYDFFNKSDKDILDKKYFSDEDNNAMNKSRSLLRNMIVDFT